jgi:Txe/YoeB family toxin of Txe-Axe toxin-antitoxin module
MLVAFSGVKFSGKDTAAEGLIRTHKFKRIGLADKLKNICSVVFEVDREDMDDPTLKEAKFRQQILLTNAHIKHLLEIVNETFPFDIITKYETLTELFNGTSISSIRELLQFVGTDICRNHIKDDIWLAYIHDLVKNTDGNIVITDARFRNEREYLKDIGAVLILIKRPGLETKSTHISENDLGEESDYDVVVKNNSSITSLQSDISMWFTLVKDAATSYKSRIK